MKSLEDHPLAFDFFHAIRLIQCRNPQHPRVGYSRSPGDDPIRFGQHPSLAFAPGSIDGFTPADATHPPKLWINFLGMLGPNGPLPLHLTEYARDRELSAGDATLARFLEVFHHSLISFFFRAWAASKKTVDIDRPDHQRFAVYIGSFFGLGMESLQGRDEVPDAAKLFYSGRLASQTRNAEGLAAILSDYFGILAQIETFVGHWLRLPEDSVCRLGASPTTGSLGVNLIAGSHIWDAQLKFRIRMGPMGQADFHRLLPHREAFQKLRCWVLNYVGREFFWDAQFVLRAAEVPEVRLGQSGFLGWNTWLKTQPFARDAEDLILVPPD